MPRFKVPRLPRKSYSVLIYENFGKRSKIASVSIRAGKPISKLVAGIEAKCGCRVGNVYKEYFSGQRQLVSKEDTIDPEVSFSTSGNFVIYADFE